MLVMAEDAVLEFPALRTMRILHPKLPSLKIGSDDAVSKRRVVLPKNVPWDDVDWDDKGFADNDGHDESDVDLFDDSASRPHKFPLLFLPIPRLPRPLSFKVMSGTHYQSRLALR